MLTLITNTLTARANQCWRACVKSVCCARLLSQVPCNRKWWFEGKCLCFENNFKGCVCVLKGESEVFWREQLDWPMFKNSTFSVTQKIPHYINQKGFFTRPLLQKGSSLQEEILSVGLCVCLSVITFSFFEYSIIWRFRPCKPYIFWKLIMLASSTALFWPSTTEYQPVPPSTDPVFNDLMV